MREELIQFGAENSMIGILSTADGVRGAKLGCLLPNIGLAHRIGPHRINVKVSRRLAECGIYCLRFDLSGIGDSPNVKTPGDVIEQAVMDMRGAMDYMHHHHGIERFMVFGICSGAQNGYFLALKDPRIVGLLMYDGFDFPSLSSKLAHKAFQIRNASWPRAAKRLLSRILPKSTQTKSDIFVTALDEMHPTRDQFRDALNTLIARRVEVFALFSGSRRAHDRHRGLLSGIRSQTVLDKITYRFEKDLDHTATSNASQQRLLSIVSEWARKVADQ